jgi:hypothetical protein
LKMFVAGLSKDYEVKRKIEDEKSNGIDSRHKRTTFPCEIASLAIRPPFQIATRSSNCGAIVNRGRYQINIPQIYN